MFKIDPSCICGRWKSNEFPVFYIPVDGSDHSPNFCLSLIEVFYESSCKIACQWFHALFSPDAFVINHSVFLCCYTFKDSDGNTFLCFSRQFCRSEYGRCFRHPDIFVIGNLWIILRCTSYSPGIKQVILLHVIDHNSLVR